jgi:hypothetical protein
MKGRKCFSEIDKFFAPKCKYAFMPNRIHDDIIYEIFISG